MTVHVNSDKPINESGFEVLPEALYNVRVDKIEVRQGNEYPKLGIKTTILSGEHADRVLWGNISLSPNAIGFLKQFLDATNCFCEANSFDEQEIVGQTAKVEGKHYSKRDGSIGISINQWFPADEEFACERKDITVVMNEVNQGEDEFIDSNDLPF